MMKSEPRNPVEDMERIEPVLALRQRTVEALGQREELAQRRRAAAELARRLEGLAIHALAEDRDRVRSLLDQRVEALKQEEALAEQLRVAEARTRRLTVELKGRGGPTSDGRPGGPA